jgi:hypothetical protein
MTCTRSWSLLALIGLGLACTRDNPAFEDEAAGDETETRGDGDTTTAISTDDESSDDASSDDASSDDATTDPPVDDIPPELCEAEVRGGLSLRFADPFLLDGGCPESLEMHGLLHFDPNTQQLVLDRCGDADALCQNECGFEKHPVVVDFDIGTFIGSCVKMQTYKPLDAGGDICSWGTLAMFPSGNSSSPLAIATTAGVQPVDAAANVLGGQPTLSPPTSMCTCQSLGIDDPCCTQSDLGVMFFDFLLSNQTPVSPGSTGTVELPMSAYTYKFHGVQAQRVGDCATISGLDVSWVMTAEF